MQDVSGWKKLFVVIANEAFAERLEEKRNEAISNSCDCFSSLRYARNDIVTFIYFHPFSKRFNA